MSNDKQTMIAINTDSVEEEISERADLDASFAAECSNIQRKHINEALLIVQPDDAFWQAFDALRMRVIETAAELAAKEAADLNARGIIP